MSSARITLIHATPLAIDPIVEAFDRLWPEAQVFNLLEDSLSSDVARDGEITPSMAKRFRDLSGYAIRTGADGILFTCSAFGPAIEAAAAEHADIPILKPNEAMFLEAIERAGKAGLIVTFERSLPPMVEEFRALCMKSGRKVTLITRCVPQALEALKSGDADQHNTLLAEAAKDLGHCDSLMLAQFSTAQAKDPVADASGTAVLTSPDSAVLQLKSRLA